MTRGDGRKGAAARRHGAGVSGMLGQRAEEGRGAAVEVFVVIMVDVHNYRGG